MPPPPLVTDTIGLMMGGVVDSDCVIDWAYNSKLNDVKKEIGISMGIHCQWWFSPLWFDRISWWGGGQNRMTYVFPCHLAWDPSALVWWNVGAEKTLAGSHVRFPQHFGERKQIILGNDLSAKQKRHKIKQFVSFSFSNNKCSPRHLIWVPSTLITTLTYLLWLKEPGMIYTPTKMRRKKQEIITYFIIIFRVTTISYYYMEIFSFANDLTDGQWKWQIK